jgi:hypothetical protein
MKLRISSERRSGRSLDVRGVFVFVDKRTRGFWERSKETKRRSTRRIRRNLEAAEQEKDVKELRRSRCRRIGGLESRGGGEDFNCLIEVSCHLHTSTTKGGGGFGHWEQEES